MHLRRRCARIRTSPTAIGRRTITLPVSRSGEQTRHETERRNNNYPVHISGLKLRRRYPRHYRQSGSDPSMSRLPRAPFSFPVSIIRFMPLTNNY
jgi:hypothetical protein